MSQLLDMVMKTVGNQAAGNIASKLGLGDSAAQGAIAAALPMLLGAMAKNTQKSNGASALAGALDKDHDGSILDDIGGFIGGGGNSAVGSGILKHLLGGNRGQAEQEVASKAGLQPQQSAQLLEMLAPLLMGSLGKQKREQGFDADGLAAQLQGFKQQTMEKEPEKLGFLGKMLDKDGDGDVKDDMLNIGKNLLGNLFKK